jgi:carbonic anhydrase
MNKLSWQEALEKLKKGNKNFVADKLDGKLQNSSRRLELVSEQKPYAIILGCSDSRVVPELAFDTGLGELFVIRIAGNVATKPVVASIEYAVSELNVKLIVVMGHQNCGAITAALNEHESEDEANFRYLFRFIKPAVRAVDEKTVNSIVIKNTELTSELIYKSSRIIRKEVDAGGVKIIPAYYKIGSGKLEFFE